MSMSPIQRVLNAAARVVCGLRPRDHVTDALVELHWLPVVARIISSSSSAQGAKWSCTVLRHNSRLPSHLDNNDLIISQSRLHLGERDFWIAAPRVWNSLPSEWDVKLYTLTHCASVLTADSDVNGSDVPSSLRSLLVIEERMRSCE